MLYFQVVYTHFTMIGSREQATWTGNQKFWPVDGGATLRPVNDCMQLQAVAPKAVQPGSNTFPYEIGNGASHIGLCSAFLEEAGKETPLNTELDCISNKQAMTVDIPNVNCDRCTLKIKVAANHQVTTIENYDSCLDISVSGTESTIGPNALEADTAETLETPSSQNLTVAAPSTTDAVPVGTGRGRGSRRTKASSSVSPG